MDLSIIGDLGPAILDGAKIIVMICLGIYTVFAFVVVRQVDLMTKTLQIGLESTIKVIAYLHFLLAVGLLLISIFVL